MGLLETVAAEGCLRLAWEKVRANRGGPGADGVSVDAFGRDVGRRLRRISETLLAGSWEAWPLLRVRLERPGKKPRYLAVPTVRDRVVHSAVALCLTPLLEKEFESCSYAYRAGYSLQQAIARIETLRDQGFHWVVDADIDSYFDQINHAKLLAVLARYVPDEALLALVRRLCRGVVRSANGEEGDYCLVKGVAQGSPLSPLLANLYLDTLDEALLDNGNCLVRFADDFLVLCRDRQQAEDALELTGTVLSSLSLRFNQQKTRIVDFETGFRFLGTDFLREAAQQTAPARAKASRRRRIPAREAPAQPPARTTMAAAFLKLMREQSAPPVPELGPGSLPASARLTQAVPEDGELGAGEADDEALPHGVSGAPLQFDPLLRTLYLNTPGLYLHREGERLLVRNKGQDVESLPGRQVSQIVLHGNQALSTGVLEYCAEHQIGVSFQSPRGGCYASLAPFADERVELLRGQFQRENDAPFRLGLARAIAHGKLANQRLVLRRYQRRRQVEAVEEAIQSLTRLLAAVTEAEDENVLRGCEGAGARTYFAALGALLPAHWGFAGRNRQPPTDPANAMLSYGYAVLFSNMLTLIRRRGLHAHLGILHTPHHHQPALASDLMEEFRPLVVDAVVLRLLLSTALAPADFTQEEGMCRMNTVVRRNLVAALENKFNTQLLHPLAESRMDYRRAMQYQVQLYARVMLGEAPAYQSMVLR